MPNKKGKKMERCPECGCAVKKENLGKHIRKSHAAVSQETSTGNGSRLSKAEERKKLELGRKKMKMNIVFSVVLMGLLAIVLYFVLSGENGGDPTSYETSDVVGDEVRIPVSEITTTANFYTYDADGVSIKYFAVKGSDGNIHIATDACDVCYDAKKGYRQSGSDMLCKKCGLTFPINSLGTENEKGGGCWPSHLPTREEGGYVFVKTSDLAAKKFMFQ